MKTEYRIRGYLVGSAWMPAAECYKPLNYSFVRDALDKASPWQDARDDLRDALLHVTNDGDFQSASVADGFLTIRRELGRGLTHTRSFPLDRFPSVRDLIRSDWDGPSGEDF